MHKLISRSKSLRESKGSRRAGAAKTSLPLHDGPDETQHIPSYNGHAALNKAPNNHLFASYSHPVRAPYEPKMPERPSSSRCAGQEITVRRQDQFNKRVSRDDFYVVSSTYSETVRFRGQSQNPSDASPKITPVRSFAIEPKSREPSPNYRGDAHNGKMRMVSSSVPQSPVTRGPKEQTVPVASPLASKTNAVEAFDIPLTRKPTGKWNFRGIFGRKQTAQSISSPSSPDSNGRDGINGRLEKIDDMICEASPSNKGNLPRSSTIKLPNTPKSKPIAARSQTLPLGIPGDQKSTKNERREDEKFAHDQTTIAITSESRSTAGLILNVEIPDIQLERYSVMFNSVLNPSSSLPMDQAIVQESKNTEDAIEKEEDGRSHNTTREETSPQPATMLLGPALIPTSSQGEHQEFHMPSPRLRSHTAPAHLLSSETIADKPMPSYNQHSFGGETSNSASPGHHAHHDVEKLIVSATANSHVSEKGLPQIPDHSNTDQSNPILDSPAHMKPGDESDTAIINRGRQTIAYHRPSEQERQTMSTSPKFLSTAPSNASRFPKRSTSLAAPSRPHVKRSSGGLSDRGGRGGDNSNDDKDDDENDDGDDVFYDTFMDSYDSSITSTEVSIARQVSISRQRRTLIRPLRTGPRSSQAPMIPKLTTVNASRLVEGRISPLNLTQPPKMLDAQPALLQN
ncbi:hypothetical protein GGS21DRAFT_71065 [Xylaria nigripes]|nr:hypothetical protein GGS21DRAFT_71065 [Xylaria nigripes]